MVAGTETGKNLKPVIPKSKWNPHKAFQETNDFRGPVLNKKSEEIFFLACIDVIQNMLQLKFLKKLMALM